MTPPVFWQKPGSIFGMLLSPLGWLYDWGRRLRQTVSKPYVAEAPVLCVGNLTVGGVGKTPTVRALAQMMQDMGYSPALATRGYGGRLEGPVLVNTQEHIAKEVGDEPLMLARDFPVWKAQSRRAGVIAAARNADVVIMDDGKQNPTVHKTATLVVVDEGAGFGNGLVLPAGPLREPLQQGLRSADAVLVIADPKGHVHESVRTVLSGVQCPVWRGWLEPSLPPSLEIGMQVEALAGIGRPQKFYDTLENLGLNVTRYHSFPDHYAFTEADLAPIVHNATVQLVTTEKDYMRLPEALRSAFQVVRVDLRLDVPNEVNRFLGDVCGCSEPTRGKPTRGK